MRYILFYVITILSSVLCLAQDTLTFDEYMQLVRKYHPHAKSADLMQEMGDRGIAEARGGFDPELFLKYKNKDYQGNSEKPKEYYSLFHAGVKIPTITGIMIKGGYELNEGYYLNPENTVPEYGLSYIGVVVPLGKGLFTDENRQALRLAKINLERAQQNRQQSLNELLQDAAVAYWDWYYNFQQVKAIERSYELAENRLDYVVRSYQVGEYARLDTVKAFVQRQDRLIALREAVVDWKVKGYMLNNYIWNNDTTYVLAENLVPQSGLSDYLINVEVNDEAIDTLVQRNPSLINYSLKLRTLEVERRWKIEKLKPKLNVEYNVLYPATDIEVPNTFSTNYKWGVSASFPLFLRSERAGLRLNTLKIQDTEYNIAQKRRELNNKILAAYYTLSTLLNQYESVLQNIEAYQELVRAQQVKFSIGESDLFILNEWENKFQMALIKKAKMEFKIMKAKAKLEYLTNTIDPTN